MKKTNIILSILSIVSLALLYFSVTHIAGADKTGKILYILFILVLIVLLICFRACIKFENKKSNFWIIIPSLIVFLANIKEHPIWASIFSVLVILFTSAFMVDDKTDTNLHTEDKDIITDTEETSVAEDSNFNTPVSIIDETDNINKLNEKSKDIQTSNKQEKSIEEIVKSVSDNCTEMFDKKFNLNTAQLQQQADNYIIPSIEIFNYTNSDKENVIRIYDLLDTFEFIGNTFNVCLGKDDDGNSIYCDLIREPHLLISGNTGTGKSICMQAIITSLLLETKPDEVKFLLIDPKAIEFKRYSGIPQLLIPVVTDARKASGALGWAVSEMLQRYNRFTDIGIRDIDGYNSYAEKHKDIEKMPHIMIFIDGLELLIFAAKAEVEDSICRLSAMARTVGIHLIISTQQEKIIKKANINTTIKTEIVYNENSDVCYQLLYKPSNTNHAIRISGCYVSEKETEILCKCIKKQTQTYYDDLIQKEIEKKANPYSMNSLFEDNTDGWDSLLEKAAEIVIETGQASTSFLQRKLSVGYARGAKIIDQLQEYGVIGPAEGSKPRKVLMTKQMWLDKRAYTNQNDND